MWGANTRSLLARFGDNNWEKGEVFVKTCYVKKLVWEMERSLSARALDDVWNDTIMLRKANWDKTLQKSLKFSYCRKRFRKQIRPSCRKSLSTSFCVCFVSWKQWNLEIRANILKSCRRHVVSLLYTTKSALGDLGLYCSEFMLGMRTCLPCHIPDRWSRNANRIWPDLAFGFVHKRSGNEIKTALFSANQNRVIFSCILL